MNTYFFASQYFDPLIFDSIMEKRGNYKKSDNPNITYLYLDGTNLWNESYHKKQSLLKNIVSNKSKINDKEKLYQNFKSHNPTLLKKYMMKQYFITTKNYKTIPPKIFKHIWIIKPVKEGSGKGIQVIENYDQFINYITTTMETYPKFSKFGWVLDKYIIDPLLFNGYKFHIRVMVLFFMGQVFLFRYGYLLTAKEPYKRGDFTNKLIHDSHYHSRVFYQYPDEIIKLFGEEREKEIFNQMKELFGEIGKFIKLDCYPESKYCYEIFGGDIMITKDFKIKLLEMNKEIGIGPFDGPVWEKFVKNYLDGQLEVTLDRIVRGGSNSAPKNSNFIDITRYTYYFDTTFFKDYHNVIDKIMTSRGNWDKGDINGHLDFLYLDGYGLQDPKYYTKHAKIRNIINLKAFTDKYIFYKLLNTYNPKITDKFMMKQHYITMENYTSLPKSTFDSVWIIKPVKECANKGIQVLDNYESFINYIKSYSQQYPKQVRFGWALEKYITHPLLIGERKFHIRVYYLYFRGRGYLFRYGKIFPARQKYVSGDWGNKLIHETHNFGFPFSRYPDDFIKNFGEEKEKEVFNQMKELFYHITKIASFECFPESEYCYYIFGGDIMVNIGVNGGVVLLEINKEIGIGPDEGPVWEDFLEKYIESQIMVTVDEVIRPANMVEKKGYFIEVTNYLEGGGYYEQYLKYKMMYKEKRA